MSEPLRLELEWTLPASRERVFRALVEPADLEHWWGPNGFTIPDIQIDLRPGGAYRFAMQPPEGELFHLRGEYREVEPPERLSYTFVWEEPDPDDRETLVTLTVREAGENAGLILSQGEFATEARLELHRNGWSDGLGRLEQRLAAEHSG